MPKLPDTYDRRPTPKFGVTPDQARPVVRSGYSDLAAGLDSLGQSFTRLKVRDDKYRVKDATTRMLERVQDIEKGDQGYKHVKGGDVFSDDKFMERQNSRFNEAVDEMQKRLKGQDQSEMFASQVDVMRLRFQEQLIDHVTKENDAYHTEVHENKQLLTQEVAADSYDKPAQFQAYINDLKREAVSYGQENGQSEEKVLVEILKATSPTVYSAIANAVDAKDTDHARDLLKEYSGELTEQHERQAKKLIDGAEGEYKAQAIADELFDQFERGGCGKRPWF
jgi:hypothetical protein